MQMDKHIYGEIKSSFSQFYKCSWKWFYSLTISSKIIIHTWVSEISTTLINELCYCSTQLLCCAITFQADFQGTVNSPPINENKFLTLRTFPISSVAVFSTWTEKYTIGCIDRIHMKYRVIKNDCRGFNNLSYTIHLR